MWWRWICVCRGRGVGSALFGVPEVVGAAYFWRVDHLAPFFAFQADLAGLLNFECNLVHASVVHLLRISLKHRRGCLWVGCQGSIPAILGISRLRLNSCAGWLVLVAQAVVLAFLV
jgi:hypothetical protein